MIFKTISEELSNKGFSFFSYDGLSRKEVELIFCKSVSRIEQDILIPRKENKENPGAWSNLYSDREFPPHTDFAYQTLPPKYIVLHCINNDNSNRPTYLLDSDSIPVEAKNKLSKVLWKINHPEKNGTMKIFKKFPSINQTIVRYDPTCMTPYFRKDKWAINLLENVFSTYAEKIIWDKAKILILDNWRCLHSRGVNSLHQGKKEGRVLTRYSIYI
ncbi:TauD/TfdA family dioxygenase [Vibrio tubiashii]|nr:TauD/TfdA family dioxygenase [Vibrio tubiashii]